MFRWWYSIYFSNRGIVFITNRKGEHKTGGMFHIPLGYMKNRIQLFNGHLTSISANKLIAKYV